MKKRILITDDDEPLRQALEQLLELEGFGVVGAPDGRTALGLVQQARYDLVLLDVKMPGPEGLEVLAALRTLLPELPIILMSGQAGRNTISDALRGGARDFILKPFDDEVILAAVKRALAHSSTAARTDLHRQRLPPQQSGVDGGDHGAQGAQHGTDGG
jgi:DNA-binding NtrC family response regulator